MATGDPLVFLDADRIPGTGGWTGYCSATPGSTFTRGCSSPRACPSLAHTAFILGCWLRARTLEPLLMAPAVLASRLAYSAGMAVGGIQWLRRRSVETSVSGPRWQ
jgi:hypothetical protein